MLIIVCIKLLKKEGVRNLVRNMFLEVIMKLVGNKNVNLGGIKSNELVYLSVNEIS